MKKVIAWLLVLALTAAVSIGATLAYLTDTDEDVNVMTLGKVKIDQLEYERIDSETQNQNAQVQEFHNDKPLYPAVTEGGFDYTPGSSNVDWSQIGKDGYTSQIWNPDRINNEVDKMVFVKNKGDYDAYVRTVFAFEAGNYETLDQFNKMVHLNLNETDWTWSWEPTPVKIGQGNYFVATATYNKVLAPGALTEISLSQIALDSSATNDDVKAFGDTYNVLVKSQAVQADGFENAGLALEGGFGVIDSKNVPWTVDTPIVGIDVRTALHYLNGDPAAEKITTKVSKVVFGRNRDYPEIVNGYTGKLVTEEQNVDVYSYYVPDNGKYTVYFLSPDLVYAPAYSRELFKGMNQLISIDTDRLDVSKVENAYQMFMNCNKLQSLDTTGWDTSNITDMTALFYNCYELSQIKGIEDWDVSSCTTLFAAFYRLYKLQKLDLSKWNTESLTNLYMAFRYCSTLTEIDLSGWDVTKVTTMESMLESCPLLETVNTTGWKPLSVENTAFMFLNDAKLKNVIGSGSWQMPVNKTAKGMFNSCTALEAIDVTNWNMGKVENFHDLFVHCTSMKTIQGLSKWNTGSAIDMVSMFNDCASLQQLEDLGGWDMSTVKDTGYMFYGCGELLSLEGEENWDMGSVELMGNMFKGCRKIVKLDLADWDVSNVRVFTSMFSDMTSNTGLMQLQEVDFSNWDTSSAEEMNWMFYGCGSLKSMDLSKWNVSNLKTMYHMFADCYTLANVNFTGWNTPNLTDMDGTFNDCHALTKLDLSDFETYNLVDIAQIFEGCCSLKEIVGFGQWDVSSLQNAQQLFNANGTTMQIEVVDLSGWDTSTITDFQYAFNGCGNLKTVYVGDGWDVDQVTDSGSMFSGCWNIVGGNGTTFDSNKTDITYGRVDLPAVVDADGNVISEAVPGYLTHIDDKPVTE